MADEHVLSFNPETFVAPALLDDVDAVVKDAVFVGDWDYHGKSEFQSTALKLTLEMRDGNTYEQAWTVGKTGPYRPSDNGKWVISTHAGMHPQCNCAIFMTTLISGAGFPLDLIEGNITGLIGLDAHWMEIVPPRKYKDGGNNTGRKPGGVPTVSKIHSLPGENKGKSKSKGKSKGKADSGLTLESPEVEDGCVAAVVAALEENDSIARRDIARMSMGHLPTEDWGKPLVNAAIKNLIYNEEWLGDHPADWSYEDGVVQKL